ncbi:hypothetical protein MYP_4376 [Sporocytophaga myxococcoides]|uniref:Secretion system C-terminal sorting domain-containing protein n=1 Tax=Sporocytophaga myxococcoides TaxID=153721 RepID=A0A098LJH4_9BACT|nr:T9SS type A sorting domain-containing protein [Sporocytophaga myxococcoides]GAL87146.1 hypothetical protein MYP_4376 [Sporocytophaga myxococcoides]
MKSAYRPEFIIIIMAAFSLYSSAFAQCHFNNLVVNSDFSAGNMGFSSSYQFCDSENCLYAEETYTVAHNVEKYHPGFSGADHTTNSGNFLIVNGAGTSETVVWTQTINVNPQTEYNFSAWVTSLTLGDVAQLQFSINSDILGSIFYAPSSVNTWENFDIMWNSGSATTATITILDQNTTAGGNDFGIDDIKFVESCALPTHFLDISVINKSPVTLLMWRTLSERASNYFEVQRSSDGINFESIGKIKAKGSFGSIANYSFEDIKGIPGPSYYRVVEIDDEGRRETSSIVTTEEKVEINVFPNPCSGKLNIFFEGGYYNSVNIKLNDLAGIDIPLDNKILEANSVKKVLDLSCLAPGVYFLNIETGSGWASEKVVIP